MWLYIIYGEMGFCGSISRCKFTLKIPNYQYPQGERVWWSDEGIIEAKKKSPPLVSDRGFLMSCGE